MKKAIICLAILLGVTTVRATVTTNYVYVVSNIFNNVYNETIITQKVKNTHTDYYYTNYVSVVTNIYQTTFRTNVNVNVIFDNFEPWVNAASNAAANASSFADQSAASATAAGSSASAANTAASQAAASASSASSAASDGLQRINERINWFDQHSGETITQITSNITINVNAQDYSFTYTNAAGTAYDYIRVHPYGMNGGATVSSRGSYSSVKISAWPKPRVSGWWIFHPSYIDYDENGMRLQYVPETMDPIKYSGGAGVYPNGYIVPEYFYWQSGYIYMKVRVWENGSVVAWCITRYRWDNYPTPVNYGSNNGVYMNDLVGRSGYGSSDMSTAQLASFKTETRTSGANDSIEFPMSPSASDEPVIAWMREGPKISVLQDQVASLASQWNEFNSTVPAQWAALQAAVGSAMVDFSNRLENAENGYPHAYTSPGGTTYPNIIYYDRATDDGKVAVTTVGNYYPSLEYQFAPAYGGNGTANYWIFKPAYVDTDVNGLRIHYLPTEAKTITAATYNAGYKYVPRDFYWQNGVVYVVIDSYNGSNWSGRLRMKYEGTGENAWPNAILQNSTGTTLSTSYFRAMIFDSREGTIMGTSTASNVNFGYLRTNYHKAMSSYDSVLWIPGEYSVEQKPVVDWLATWVR